MAEPSAKDRQRLEALQEKLAASREEKRAWTEERRDLRARATAGDRAARRLERVDEQVARLEAALKAERAQRAELEQRLSKLDSVHDALVAENRRQAEALQGLQSESDGLRKAMAQASADRTAALAELEKATAARREIERRLKVLEAENAKNAEALRTAREQLRAGDRPQILTADEVGSLVDRLIDRVTGGVQGLDVRDGSITLKVAFAGAGDVRGFVVPSAEATEETTGPLHELALRFQRSAPG